MKNKGISLIVLIITIVVIIILATAVIVNLAQTNIINNAKEAVVKQDFITLQDELDLYIADKYSDTLGDFDASTLNANKTSTPSVYEILTSLEKSKYKDYVVIENGKIVILDTMTEPEKTWAMEIVNKKTSNNTPTKPEETTPVVAIGEIVTESNSTITGKKFTYNNPVIPVGFKAKETTDASWSDTNNDGIVDGWNNGLVIADTNENEFVWVPVDGTDVKYEKWNGSKNGGWIVTKEQVEDDTLPNGITSEIEQITKYGGFYVARYEAGLPDSETTETLMTTKTFSETDNNRTDIEKAQSKPDKIVWNRINYDNAKTVSENVISNDYVQSGLITGTQWDTMLTFLSQVVDVDIDCTSWGNYYNKYGYTINGYYRTQNSDIVYTKGEYTKSENGQLLLQTGKFGSVVEEGSPKNIYDVAGNVSEWIAETVKVKGGNGIAVGNKVFRGGGYGSLGSDDVTSPRAGGVNGKITAQDIGFRFVLYIK